MTREAFEQRVLDMERLLFCVARAILSSEADCADATQEAVLKAWLALPRLREAAAFEPWLLRILRNECYTIRRRQRRETPVETVPEGGAEAMPLGVYDALTALRPDDRLLILLHHDAGYSLRDICGILDLPLPTVKMRLARARRAARRLLEEEGQTI